MRSRVLQLVLPGDDRLFLGLGMGALDVANTTTSAAWLNVVRATEKRFHSASASGLSMRTVVRWWFCHSSNRLRNLSAVERQLIPSSSRCEASPSRRSGAFFASWRSPPCACESRPSSRRAGLLQLLELLLQRGHVADRRICRSPAQGTSASRRSRRDFTVSECRRLASRSNLALRSR